MQIDRDRVRANAEAATTEDLLDRLTVEADEMEPEALAVIEGEVRKRGIGPDEIAAHGERREQEVLRNADGTPARCSFCPRLAVARGRDWYRIWKVLPYFPRTVRYCEEHRPRNTNPTPERG